MRLDGDDGDDAFEPDEVGRVSRIQRQAIGHGGRGDQQIGHTRAARPSRILGRSEQEPIRACGGSVEGQWIPAGCSPLQAILPTRALLLVVARMRPRRELG